MRTNPLPPAVIDTIASYTQAIKQDTSGGQALALSRLRRAIDGTILDGIRQEFQRPAPVADAQSGRQTCVG